MSSHAAAERRLRAALAGVELDARGRRFVQWVERFDADAIKGLAAVVEAVRRSALDHEAAESAHRHDQPALP